MDQLDIDTCKNMFDGSMNAPATGAVWPEQSNAYGGGALFCKVPAGA